MLRLGSKVDTEALWYSEENDWTTESGDTIAVWQGCIIKEDEYSDFVEFVKEEANAEVEPIGNFKTLDGLEIFVFLVKSGIERFSTWRFNLQGMRWWFDAFSEVNCGKHVKDSEILPIINKLGLTISGAN